MKPADQNHTYASTVGRKSRQSKIAKTVHANENKIHLRAVEHNISHADDIFQSSNMSNLSNIGIHDFVGSFCTVDTTYVSHDPLHMPKHENAFEQAIRITPTSFCKCCERFLFPEQCKHVSEKLLLNIALQQLHLSSTDFLCTTCKTSLTKSRMPSISSIGNNLHVPDVPKHLSALNKIEKRLLCQIQVFMLMIILPGGQFAEKGLVLNLPVDVTDIANQVESIGNNTHMCAVNFEASKLTSVKTKHFVRPSYLQKAFKWLQENNHLYTRTTDTLNSKPSETDNTCRRCHVDQEQCDSIEENSLIPIDYTVPHVPDTLNPSHDLPVINVARSAEAPVNIYDIEYGEEKAFPWLFPTGVGGFRGTYHPQKISPSIYFRYRFYNRNAQWRTDITYLLHSAAMSDILALKQSIGVYMKMRKPSVLSQGGVPLTVADVKHSCSNPNITETSYMFMKKIRGTVAYFKNALYNVLAMFRSLGPPTIFMTLSADDLHWPELGMLLENISYDEAQQKNSFMSSMRHNPLMTAIHFERRFKALMKHVIHAKHKPLGNVKDWFIRVEFQNRGSCHYHMFLWVDGIPSAVSDDPRLLSYISQVIHTDIPSQADDPELYQLVRRLQTHSHSQYCRPTSRSICRFGFPKKVCEETIILSHSVASAQNGRFYETKRSADAVYINSYNPTILRHFRSNMDIQIINNAKVLLITYAIICASQNQMN